MKRGDLVTVALKGDHGKARPAVVIQADKTASTSSVLVCLCTSAVHETAEYRFRLEPTPLNGLRVPSLVQAEKIHAVVREKCGPVMGEIGGADLERLNNRLMFVLGLGD